ncbi:unnamed protein product [Gadus morhua 'NCC']
MDPTNPPVLPGTSEVVSVSPEAAEKEEEKKNKLYLPGVGSSSSIHGSDHLEPNRASVVGRTAADGADGTTSAPGELLGFDGAGQSRPHQGGGDDDAEDRRDECPICNERFGPSGERRLALLHCDHALCHHCLSHILKRARDPSRVQCPFCRQNTPLSSRDFAQMMLEKGCHDNAAPATSSSYSSAPLLADVQPGDPHAAPQAPLGCLHAPGSEEQPLDVWGGGACGGRVCLALRVLMRPACCLPSTTVLLVLMLMWVIEPLIIAVHYVMLCQLS